VRCLSFPVNFGEAHLKFGIKRLVDHPQRPAESSPVAWPILIVVSDREAKATTLATGHGKAGKRTTSAHLHVTGFGGQWFASGERSDTDGNFVV
jgi:hypothetical protein